VRTRLPIKVKVAVVTAALTFVILSLFATVIGALAESRITDGFEDELRATAADLQDRLSVSRNDDGLFSIDQSDRDLLRGFASGGAVARVIDLNNRLVYATSSRELGPPIEGVTDAGDFRVISRQIVVPDVAREGTFDPLPLPVAREIGWVQYAETEASVQTTINRVRLFLAFGVLGGTALAFLGGLVVARRAMRPVSGLTRAARQVARTRDPDVRLPKPLANDEVSELAYTLEDMLRELSAARGETEATLDRQRAFVADASHELRTPLTSILANLELLESDLDGEQQEMAASALRSSRRMRRLVADLLLLARADAGREAPKAPVDLAAVAREAAREAGALSAHHIVSVDAPEPVVIEGVADDLHRLAANLVENALIHTPGGTPVTVSVRREGDSAVLEVSDRGPGVSPAMRERVFERFARGGGDAAPSGGSGLGLAIVRAVAEAHGGSVELDDAESGGARFTVRLPAGARSDGRASVLTPGEPDPGFLKEPQS
jgi:two-component system, OmpR family, sensor kinase